MIVEVITKRTNFSKIWNIENYDNFHDFCKLYNLDLHLDINDDLEFGISKEIDKIESGKYHFQIINAEKEEVKPSDFFERHLYILQSLNNIDWYDEDIIDKQLLSQILLYNCNKDYKSTNYLLNPLTYKWFDASTAKKVYELLMKSFEVDALIYAEQLKQCKYWGLEDDS